MKQNIKIHIEYVGGWSSTIAQEYRLVKIVGAPKVQVMLNGSFVDARVGEIITEKQAEDLSSRFEVTTTKATK